MSCNIKRGMFCKLGSRVSINGELGYIYGYVKNIRIIDSLNQAYVDVLILMKDNVIDSYHNHKVNTITTRTIHIENTKLSEKEINRLEKLITFQ